MVKEQLWKRREQVLEAEGGHATQVSLEWVLPGSCSQFNLRIALETLWEKFRSINPKVYYQSSIDNTNWKQVSDLPSGIGLTRDFGVKQEPHQKYQMKVKAFVMIISKLCLNTLKLDPTVYAHLKKHIFFIRPDLFMRNNVVSIGQITCVHPKMVNQEDFITKISRSIKKHAPPNNAVVRKWIIENGKEMDGMGVPSAEFRLSESMKKFRDGEDRVEATTFDVVCKYKGSLYLKSMMAVVWSRKYKPIGVFEPAQAELITLSATYKQLLRNHNMYIDSITCV
eukprot:12913753-Ditylum_brightwellii.AAC.2